MTTEEQKKEVTLVQWSPSINNTVYHPLNSIQREDAIDFSYHYVPEYIDWVTAKPLPVEKWTAVFKPFSIPTWIFFITFTLAAGPILATLVHLSGHDPMSKIHGIQRSGGLINGIKIDLSSFKVLFHVNLESFRI